jgi:hypothetical protein
MTEENYRMLTRPIQELEVLGGEDETSDQIG